LPAEGVLVTSSSGDLIAGIFQGFNNETLSTGDHYLIINNDTDSITIRQPLGPDTDLTIDRPDSWTDDSKIRVYFIGRMKVQEAPNYVSGIGIHFRWERYVLQDTAKYYIITYDKIVGIKDINVSDLSGIPLFQVYPNPFNNKTIIQFPNSQSHSYDLVITDLTGKVVRVIGKITENSYELSKDGLPAGLYFIELRGPNIYRGKIVIE
jgi:hypothetical protein